MFEAREYSNITKLEIMNENFFRICATYNNTRKEYPETEYINCIWIPYKVGTSNSSLRIHDIKNICSHSNKSTHYIFVTDNVSFQGLKYLSTSRNYFEILSYNETLYAKHNHIFVPSYKLLSLAEVKDIEKRYGSKTFFNKMIAKQDAMARYFDFRVGDVVQIEQYSITSGTSIKYRLLVRGG